MKAQAWRRREAVALYRHEAEASARPSREHDNGIMRMACQCGPVGKIMVRALGSAPVKMKAITKCADSRRQLLRDGHLRGVEVLAAAEAQVRAHGRPSASTIVTVVEQRAVRRLAAPAKCAAIDAS